MKLDFEFACDQLNATNHSLLLELSSSASCQHILTMCIHSCTYMDTLPLIMKHRLATERNMRRRRKEMNRKASVKWEKVTENIFCSNCSRCQTLEIELYDRTFMAQ